MRYIILFLAGLLLPLSIHAQSRQLDAHEHGAAKVMMAMEGKMLQLQFEVPSDSLIGFEYSPESEKDRKVFAYAMTILSNPTNLFDIPDEAECIPVGIKVSQTLFSGEGEHHEGEHHDHGDDHDDGKSEKEIYDFLIEKYGEWIVYDTGFNKNTFILWGLPVLLFFLGGAIILKKFIVQKL